MARIWISAVTVFVALLPYVEALAGPTNPR